MTATAKNTVLTDVAAGVYVAEFNLSAAAGIKLAGSSDWSISKRTLRGGLSDGVDVVELNNGLLSFSVLPTRGMGLWRGKLQGLDLGWKSPVTDPVNPSYVNLTERSGLGWLAGFNEWMCRCGLSWHGEPGLDVVQSNTGAKIETPLTLHGKIANLPAHHVEVSASEEGKGMLRVTGIVDETMVFGPRLRLKATYETEAGSNRLKIVDEVTNIGGQPTEFELLYHTNMGSPFLEKGAMFVAPMTEVAPTNDHAATDMKSWQTYREPVAGYVEQCYFIELKEDKAGDTLAMLKNARGDKAISLHFNRRQLPCFTIWKNTQAEADGYVTGLEPATSLPNLKTFEREQGRVITLAPGETYQSELTIAVHNSAAQVAEVQDRINLLQGDAHPTIHPKPHPKYSRLA